MGTYESVEAYLEAQRRGRPQSFEEITKSVEKSRPACMKEIRSLILYGKVRIIVLRFNNRDCSFYTIREDVTIEVVKGATKY